MTAGNDPGSLRAQAEALVAARGNEADTQTETASVDRVVHELDVHRVELELQNEELRRAQDEIAESRDRYADLFDFAPIAYVTLDQRGVILDANLRAGQLLATDRAKLIGQPLGAFTARNAETNSLYRYLNRASANGSRESGELVLVVGHKEVPVHLESVCHARKRDGSFTCRTALIDLSDLHSARSRFEMERSRSESILDAIDVAIVTGNFEGEVTSINRSAERMFGRAQSEVLGIRVCELFPNRCRAQIEKRVGRVTTNNDGSTNRFSSFEMFALHVDGTEVPVEVTLNSWWDDNGRKFVVLLRDSSELKRAERERMQLKEKLYQSQKQEALGTLARGVAHDFNNVLMGIIGCADIAASMVAPESSAHVFLSEIRSSAATGAAISKQLATFAMTDEQPTTVLNVNDVVAGAETMLRRLLGESLELVIKLEAEDSWVSLGSGQLEQVVMNLVVNSRDAMGSKGGRMWIETRSVSPSADCPNGSARGEILLSVIDNGKGMSEEVQSRLFEPFYSTKDRTHGSGLGLSVVHGIVEQAGGRIVVTSREGAGARFDVYLPRSGRDWSRAEPPQPHGSHRDAHETILLVEDERAVRMATRFYLERLGYKVLEATNGAEAIECCKKYPKHLDLLLTDVVLPGLSGPELAKQVVKNRPGISVLYMSAHDARTLRSRWSLPSDAIIVQKPFTEQGLGADVEMALVKRGS